MPSGTPIDGMAYVGYEYKGIKIVDVYRMPSGMWGAEVRCSCGRVFKTSLRQARGMCCCIHRKKKRSKYD